MAPKKVHAGRPTTCCGPLTFPRFLSLWLGASATVLFIFGSMLVWSKARWRAGCRIPKDDVAATETWRCRANKRSRCLRWAMFTCMGAAHSRQRRRRRASRALVFRAQDYAFGAKFNFDSFRTYSRFSFKASYAGSGKLGVGLVSDCVSSRWLALPAGGRTGEGVRPARTWHSRASPRARRPPR